LLKLRQAVIDFKAADAKAAKQGWQDLLARHDQILAALEQISQIGPAAKEHTGFREAIERRLREPDLLVAAEEYQKKIEQARVDLTALQSPAAGVAVTSAQVLAFKKSLDTLMTEITEKKLSQFVKINDLDLMIDEAEKMHIQTWISEQNAAIAKPKSLVEIQAIQLHAMDVEKQLDDMVFLDGEGNALKQSFTQMDAELSRLVNLHLELKRISEKTAEFKTRYAVKAALTDLKAEEIAADKTAIDELFAATQAFAAKVDKPRFGKLFTDLSTELTAVSDVRVARSLARRFAAEIAAVAGQDAAAQLKAGATAEQVIDQEFQKTVAAGGRKMFKLKIN